MSMMRRLLLTLVVLVLGATTAACADDESTSAADSSASSLIDAEDAVVEDTTTEPAEPPAPADPPTSAPEPGPEPESAPDDADVAQPPEPVSEVRTLTHDGIERRYRLHVPAGLAAGEDVPLLVALHGGTGTADQFEASAGFEDLADTEGFIVVTPNGVGTGPDNALQTWNGGYCCGPAMNQDVDDVGFLVALVDEVARDHPVDRDRVFAAGHSNGAIMAYRLACEASDTFAAIGAVAGSLGVDCNPSQPVSVLHIHGLADDNHPVEGGRGSKSITPPDFRFDSAEAAISTWVEVDGCPAEPAERALTDVTVQTWGPCEDGTEVELQLIADGEHAWPGSDLRGPVAEQLAGQPSQALDATAVVWDFLSRHGR